VSSENSLTSVSKWYITLVLIK